MKNTMKKLKLKLRLALLRTMYRLAIGKTYKLIYSAESNRFEPKEYTIFRPFGKFTYREGTGEGLTAYVPDVDDIRRFRLDRINRFDSELLLGAR